MSLARGADTLEVRFASYKKQHWQFWSSLQSCIQGFRIC